MPQAFNKPTVVKRAKKPPTQVRMARELYKVRSGSQTGWHRWTRGERFERYVIRLMHASQTPIAEKELCTPRRLG